MKVLFISSVNLTSNPRILKEIQLASDLNYEVTFLGFNLGNWSDEIDKKTVKELPTVTFIYLNATRKNYFTWLFYSLVNIASRFLYRYNKQSLFLAAAGHSKRTLQILNKLKQLKVKSYEMIVAHNLATLYSAYVFSQQTKCRFAFDVEDYHPGEKVFGLNAEMEKKRRELLLQKILPKAVYVSSASPLISKSIDSLVDGVRAETVLNLFSISEFTEPVIKTSDKLKLVWFSQNINAGRGLELVLSIWDSLKEYFELTLIGKIDNQFYEMWIKKHKEIIIQPPLPQKTLHNYLSRFDIGLAIDVDSDDYNRQLAITNKIVAYFQAGLYIIATNTPAQTNFVEAHELHGLISEQNELAMLYTLKQVNSLKDNIRSNNKTRFKNASGFSWEKESGSIKNIWRQINTE
ncbi:MAG: hypothetical protein WKF85_00505 [Chitinophagaceae bacterium]